MGSPECQLTEAKIQEVVDRVVAIAHPVKVVLFGSAARGPLGPHSDIDLLVIVQPGESTGQLAGDIHEGLLGVGWPIDVIVVTTDEVERYRHSPALVIKPALAEGRVVHAA